MPLGAFRLNSISRIISGGARPLTLTLNGQTKIVRDGEIGNSIYFDGSGDYISSTQSISTPGNYTIECWIYPFRVNSGAIWVMGSEAAGRTVMYFENGTIRLDTFGSGTPDYSGAGGWTTAEVDTWTHIAYVRDSGTVRIYKNGVLQVTASSNVDFNAGGFSIGPDVHGLIDEFRISHVARYNSNFTPNTTGFASDNDTVLLIHGDGDADSINIIDNIETTYSEPSKPQGESRHKLAFNVDSNPVISTASNKFGGASLFFNGSASNNAVKTTIPASLVPANSNWTIEGWIAMNVSGHSGYWPLINTTIGGCNMRGFGGGANAVEYYFTDVNGANAVNWNGDAGYTQGTYLHWAIVRVNDSFIIYINGVDKSNRGGYTSNYSLFGNTTNYNNIQIGGNNMNGYFDDVRVSNVARYITAFTPPTASFTNDRNTLLLMKCDGTNGSQLMVDTSTPLTTANSVFFNGQATSTASTITMPNSAKVDDYAFLFDTSTTTTLTVPSGWTQISTTTTTGIRTTVSYKKLVAGDLNSTITGMGGTTRKVLLVYTPNANAGISLSTPGAQSTTSTPSNQTISTSGFSVPGIFFAVYGSTGAVSTRGWSGGSPQEYSSVSTSVIYVRALMYSTGQSASNATISMSDGGTNTLQSFWARFT